MTSTPRPKVVPYSQFLEERQRILDRVAAYEKEYWKKMKRRLPIVDPLVKRFLFKRTPAYRKQKRHQFKYAEFGGKKPPFPGYDPYYYKKKAQKKHEEEERRPSHLKKYSEQYKHYRERAKDVFEGPQRAPKPVYTWKEGSWDIYSDDPPAPGITFQIIFPEGTEPYYKELQRIRREEAKQRLLKYRIAKRREEARRKLMRNRGHYILSDDPI